MENMIITISKEEYDELLRAKFSLELIKNALDSDEHFYSSDIYKLCGWKKERKEKSND